MTTPKAVPEKDVKKQLIFSFMESIGYVYVTEAQGHRMNGWILKGPRGVLIDWTTATVLYEYFASTRQATIKEVVERLKAEAPEDLLYPPRESHSNFYDYQAYTEAEITEAKNVTNAQWRAALKKIEEEM